MPELIITCACGRHREIQSLTEKELEEIKLECERILGNTSKHKYN